MTYTGFETFDKTLQKTNEILKLIEKKFGWQEHRNQSYALFRAILTTLRDRLTVDEAVHFGAQLTILLRGIYYEGWDPSVVPIKMNKEEFLDKIRGHLIFSIEGNFEEMVSFALKTLMSFIGEGEEEKIKSVLPKDINEIL